MGNNLEIWPKNYRSSHQRCSVKKVFSEISQNSQEKNTFFGCFWNYSLIIAKRSRMKPMPCFLLDTYICCNFLLLFHLFFVTINPFQTNVLFYTFWKPLAFFYRSSRSQMFFKIGDLKYFVLFTGKHLCCSLFLTKLQAFSSPWNDQKTIGFLMIPRGIGGLQLCQKETPTQMLPCAYCEIFKNAFL